MRFPDYEKALSTPRLGRYLRACGGNKQKALVLYRLNVRLSQRFSGVLGIFEVVLRTAINEHFLAQLSDSDWIVNQAASGFLARYRDSIVKEHTRQLRDGSYTNDRILSSLSFGTWTSMFSRRCYRDSGKTLLQVFPNKPHGLNQAGAYRMLDSIRVLRNRVAHQEPICFNKAGEVDTNEARQTDRLIREFIYYLGYNPKELLFGIERPDSILAKIDSLVR